METFEKFENADRKKKPTPVRYRFMTRDEILALTYNDHPEMILNNGRTGTVKVNGAVKRWKRDADRAEIPVKYGLYVTYRLSLSEALTRFVVRVHEGEV